MPNSTAMACCAVSPSGAPTMASNVGPPGRDVERPDWKMRGERMAHRRLQTRRVVPGHGRQQRDLARVPAHAEPRLRRQHAGHCIADSDASGLDQLAQRVAERRREIARIRKRVGVFAIDRRAGDEGRRRRPRQRTGAQGGSQRRGDGRWIRKSRIGQGCEHAADFRPHLVRVPPGRRHRLSAEGPWPRPRRDGLARWPRVLRAGPCARPGRRLPSGGSPRW